MQFVNLRRGVPGPLRPPVDSMDEYWSPQEKANVEHALAYAAVGSPETVGRRLRAILDATRADELMLTGQIYDHAARLRSFEIAADLRDRLAA
jgi:alkanesulfonate monooxygenase SsuD/methylene tetrahydromethanopterin reductase-like flavin-dependent oxidoreductase (luciferase family)